MARAINKKMVILISVWGIIALFFIQRYYRNVSMVDINFSSKVEMLLPKLNKAKEAGKITTKPQNGKTVAPTTPPKCKTMSHAELTNVKKTARGIPLIIHQIYKSTLVPAQYVPLVKSCKRVNPDFVHVLWTDEIADAFVKEYYPHYVEIFKKYNVEGAQKADYFRVLLLYHFGGVYMDMDVECIKPLSKHLDNFNHTAILDKERELQTRLRWNRNWTVMNSVMISRPRHRFFKYLLDKFPESAHIRFVMDRTGPFYVDARFREYQRIKNLTSEDKVYVVPPSAFSPLLDASLFGLYNGKCNAKNMGAIQKLGCDEWNKQNRRQDNVEELMKPSILCHRFLHLAYHFMRGAIKRKDDLCSLDVGIILFAK